MFSWNTFNYHGCISIIIACSSIQGRASQGAQWWRIYSANAGDARDLGWFMGQEDPTTVGVENDNLLSIPAWEIS